MYHVCVHLVHIYIDAYAQHPYLECRKQKRKRVAPFIQIDDILWVCTLLSRKPVGLFTNHHVHLLMVEICTCNLSHNSYQKFSCGALNIRKAEKRVK